jgi:hypothetical protein
VLPCDGENDFTTSTRNTVVNLHSAGRVGAGGQRWGGLDAANLDNPPFGTRRAMGILRTGVSIGCSDQASVAGPLGCLRLQ